jgi:hypothetical protein
MMVFSSSSSQGCTPRANVQNLVHASVSSLPKRIANAMGEHWAFAVGPYDEYKVYFPNFMCAASA